MPITIGGEALGTERELWLRQFHVPVGTVTGAFRAVLYPSVKLGSHWYGYSAIQVNSTPYQYYDAYYPVHEAEGSLIQAFLGYTGRSEGIAYSWKAGKLASAFGSFPLRYDDVLNPLLDSPPSYSRYIGLRPDQLPCGVNDLLRQRSYAFVRFSCGGATSQEYGVWPATAYGIPGAELDVTIHKLDTRFQLTNSAPSYPMPLDSSDQHLQWAAGLGYTIRQGFRVGVSAFRGPFLDQDVEVLLPAGKGVRDYPAGGEGIDVQWARGRWSTTGEWQWFQFNYPGFVTSPGISSGYVEAKAVLTPRFYGAVRVSYQGHNVVQDLQTRSSTTFEPNLQINEFALGFHINHFQLVKLGYEWVRTAGVSGSRDNVIGLQILTTFDQLSTVFK